MTQKNKNSHNKHWKQKRQIAADKKGKRILCEK